MKDASFLSRVSHPNLRRIWRPRARRRRHRALAETDRGLDPDCVSSKVGNLPASRFAVDAYVWFMRQEPLLPAVAPSLTELSAPKDPRTAYRWPSGQLRFRQ